MERARRGGRGKYAYLLAAFGKDAACRHRRDAVSGAGTNAGAGARAGAIAGCGDDAAGMPWSRTIFRLPNANGVSCN